MLSKLFKFKELFSIKLYNNNVENSKKINRIMNFTFRI